MAATITGTFVLIDRASGPMRRMEAQAIKTMAAVRGVGKAHDAAGGSGASQRRIETQGRALTMMERAARIARGALGGYGSETEQTDRKSRGLISRLGRLGAALGGIGRILTGIKFTVVIVAISALAQAVGVLAGGLVALVPAVVQASGALAALPGIAATAVQGFAAIKLATGGMGEALQAGTALQQQAGQAATDMADQQRSAAHAVQQAEYGLMQSHRAVGDAQKQLTQARRDAVRNLTDLKLASIGAAYGEQRAALNLREARKALADAAIDPGTSDLQLSGLQLGVKEAQLAARQARIDRRRTRVDSRRAAGKGVERSDGVVQARRAVTDAMHAEKEAAYQLAEAQRAAAKSMSAASGPTSAYADAMKELSPEAQSFVKKLISMRPALKNLRAEAGRELFPHLERSLTKLSRAFPTLERMTRRSGKVLGQEAERAAGRFTTTARLGDIESIGKANDRILRRMARGGANLTEALIDIMVAARPFTDWLTKTVYEGTRWIKNWARAGRESGDFARRLEKVRERLSQFWRIAKNVWGTLRGIGRAAGPLGDRLWAGAEKATRGWKRYVDSVKGQGDMRRWFDSLYEPLHEIGQLTKDLAKAWARITVQPSFVESIRALRKAVPFLEKLFTAGAGLGPSMIELMTELLRLVSNLPFSPLQALLGILTNVLRLVNVLIEKVPGLGTLLSGILLAGALRKSIGLVGTLLGKWRELATLWGSTRSPTVPMPPQSPGTPGAPGAPGAPGGPGGRGGARQRWRTARAGGAGRIGAGGRVLGYGLRGVGKFVAPITALMAGMDFLGTEGTISERAQAALSGATFGLFPGAETGKRSRERGQEAAMTVASRGRSAVKDRMATLQQSLTAQHRVSRSGGRAGGGSSIEHKLTGDARERAESQLKALREIDRRMDTERRARLRDMSRRHAIELSDGFARAYTVYSKASGPEAAMQKTTSRMLQTMGRMKGSGRAILAQNVLTWARGMAARNPQLQGVVKKMEDDIKAKFRRLGKHVQIVNGRILTGTRTEWKQISTAMRDPAEKARQEVSAAFTKLQQQAIGSLRAMGFSKADAQRLVSAMESGGQASRIARWSAANPNAPASSTDWLTQDRPNARGGRIRGVGLQDNVPVAPGHIAAPGELIANRHTESRVDRMLSLFGTSLGREVAGESRPHSMHMTFAAKGTRVRAERSKLGGVPGALSSAAQAVMAAGFNKKIRDAERDATATASGTSRVLPGGVVPEGTGVITRMQSAGLQIAAKRMPYQYGGYGNPSYDCSGYVSAILNAGGMFSGRTDTVNFRRVLEPGPGRYVTAGIRGGAGRSGHMMMKVGGMYFESGGGHGPARVSGWNGTFDMYHPANEAGKVRASRRRRRRNRVMKRYATGGRVTSTKGTLMELFRDPNAIGDPRDDNRVRRFALGGRTPDYLPQTREPKAFSASMEQPVWAGWHKDGGTFTAKKPTIFGVGEAGHEDVHITRTSDKKSGGKGGVSFTVKIGQITYNGEGDIANAIRREMELLADDLELLESD